MRSGLRKKLDDLNHYIESRYRMHVYRKNAKARLKRMNGGFDLGEDYKNVIVPYWSKFNLKPQKYWFEMFCDREKKVDPRYIPDDLWYGVIVPYYSNSQFRRFGEDKCLHDKFFPELIRPKTIVKNIAGIYYDSDMNIINKEKAIKIISDVNYEFLIKPSIDSGEGRLIEFFDNGKDLSKIRKCIDNLKANFIVQKSVDQHHMLAEFNQSSLNTIRTISFLFEGEVHILSSILRIGAENAKVDNIGAGGYAVPIDNDGKLYDKGVNRKAEWVEGNSKGVKFKDKVIPAYNDLMKTIKTTHLRQPHFKIIGWDFSIDKNSNPIFIEFNTMPGPNQLTVGPTFGDLTEKVLQDVFVDKKFKYAQN